MKLFLTITLTTLASVAFSEDNTLQRVLNERWFECHEAIYNNNFMGEPLLEDGVDIPDTEHELRKKFFTVPDDAVEKFVIGKDGQAAYAVYREKILCAGKTMHGYCGSGGCSPASCCLYTICLGLLGAVALQEAGLGFRGYLGESGSLRIPPDLHPNKGFVNFRSVRVWSCFHYPLSL